MPDANRFAQFLPLLPPAYHLSYTHTHTHCAASQCLGAGCWRRGVKIPEFSFVTMTAVRICGDRAVIYSLTLAFVILLIIFRYFFILNFGDFIVPFIIRLIEIPFIHPLSVTGDPHQGHGREAGDNLIEMTKLN